MRNLLGDVLSPPPSDELTTVPTDSRDNPVIVINAYIYGRLSYEIRSMYEPDGNVMSLGSYRYIGPTPEPRPSQKVIEKTVWSPTVRITKEPRGWEQF